MLRLVLAEATLIGLVGCALGLVAGAEMSVNARGLASITIGYVPPMAIPWGIVWGGASGHVHFARRQPLARISALAPNR